jgi:phosphate starvation-inducible protein PhoH
VTDLITLFFVNYGKLLCTTFQSSSSSICTDTVSWDCAVAWVDAVETVVVTTLYPFMFLTRRTLKSSSNLPTVLVILLHKVRTEPHAFLKKVFMIERYALLDPRFMPRLKGAQGKGVHRGNMWCTVNAVRAIGSVGSVGTVRSAAAHASKKRRAAVSLPTVVPRNANQELLLRKLNDDSIPVVIATGAAGSAKTMCAATVGLRYLLEGRVKKLVIARPVASVQGEDIGYLPGTASDKLAPTSRAVLDFLHQHVSPFEVQQMIADDRIELCSIGMVRGRTFEDSWVIFDEASSAHVSAFKAVVTRIGMGSKLVITGDEDQSDLRCENGLSDFVRRLGPGVPGEIEHVKFTAADVVRHPVIKTILALYDAER